MLRFVKLLQKQDPHGVSEILRITAKTRSTGGLRNSFKLCTSKTRQVIPEIFQATSKIKQSESQRFFKLLQKQNPQRAPRFFQTISKTKHKGLPRFFQNYFKTRQGIPEILSSYFKNKTKRIPEILQIT